jgi:hypothetical protein
MSSLRSDRWPEDEDDIAAVTAVREEDARFTARVAAERGERIETDLPIDIVRAKLDGAHPIKRATTAAGVPKKD